MTDKTYGASLQVLQLVFVVSKIVTDKTQRHSSLTMRPVFVVSKIVTDKTSIKKLSEYQRAQVLLDKTFID